MRTSNQEILSAYVDGELTAEERTALEARLESDQVLRADLRELEATVHLVRAHGPTRAPEDFLQEVLERVEQEPVQLAWYQRLRRPLGVPIETYVVTAAAAAVLLFVFQPTVSQSPLPVESDNASAHQVQQAHPSVVSEAEAKASATHLIPYAYTVTSSDPQIIARLERALDQIGGELSILTEKPKKTASLQIRLPPDAMGQIEPMLAKYGSVERREVEEMYFGTKAQVTVDVVLETSD